MDRDKIMRLLAGHNTTLAKNIYFFDTVTSTFDVVEQMTPCDGLTVTAEHQTNGRGRLGRAWQSDEGGIYFSFLVQTPRDVSASPVITLACAYGVCVALNKYTDCRIKWPNDIVCGGKKICGILCKSTVYNDSTGCISVGVGINANNTCFGADLPYASSIKLVMGHDVDREELFAEVIQSLDAAVYSVKTDYMLAQYRKLCVNINKMCKVHYLDQRQDFEGVCTDITPCGQMVVDNGYEKIIVNSGEVSVRGIYGYSE